MGEKKISILRILLEGIPTPGSIIRCIAPGFILLYGLMIVYKDFNPFKNQTLSAYPEWIIFGGIILTGFFIQAIHATSLIRVIWWPTLAVHHIKKNPLIDSLYKKLGKDSGSKKIKNTMDYIDEQRWRRRASEHREVRRFQQELDGFGLFQNLLYCSTHITFILAFCMKVRPENVRYHWRYVLLVGCLLLVISIFSEYRATQKELKASNDYFNGNKEEKSPEEKNKLSQYQKHKDLE